MSKSIRKPYIKDHPRNVNHASSYWKKIRRVLKQLVSQGKEPKNPKEITNNYDYMDYKFYSEEDKYKRK